MEQILIDNQVIRNHPLWTKLHSTFQELVRTDGKNIRCYEKLPIIDCLALDKYNQIFNIPNGGKTGDSALGISRYGKLGNLVNKEILLVELRLQYVNGRKISYIELKEKIDYSINILGRSTPIHQIYYFVFADKVAPVAQSYLQRTIVANKNRSSAKAFQVVANSEFKNSILIAKQ